MKVLIINIALRPNSNKITFPVGLAYIATAIKNAGFEFLLYDMDVLRPSQQELEDFIKKTDFDVVALGCLVSGYKHVKNIAETIKKYKNVPIIAGNSVASSIPEILLKKTKVDIGVISEGDITIVELLSAIKNKESLENVKGIFFLKNGEVFFTENREIVCDLDSLPFIDYDIFDVEKYIERSKLDVSEPYPIDYDKIRMFQVNTARGCLFDCSFCYHVFKKKRYRFRSMENIGKEIKLLQEKYGVNYIVFCDELTLFSKERVNEFISYFKKENLKVFWAADCRAGLFLDKDIDLAKKLKEVGCQTLGYSLESSDKEILKSMNKFITMDDFIIQTRVLHQAGITPVTSLVVGYPQETEETLSKTFQCCYDNDIYPSAGYLLPQPGTLMYKYALAVGAIKDEEEYLLKMGDRQDFTVNLTKMEQEKMEEIVKYHLKRINDKLKLGLSQEQLIKTGHYRQKEQKEGA